VKAVAAPASATLAQPAASQIEAVSLMSWRHNAPATLSLLESLDVSCQNACSGLSLSPTTPANENGTEIGLDDLGGAERGFSIALPSHPRMSVLEAEPECARQLARLTSIAEDDSCTVSPPAPLLRRSTSRLPSSRLAQSLGSALWQPEEAEEGQCEAAARVVRLQRGIACMESALWDAEVAAVAADDEQGWEISVCNGETFAAAIEDSADLTRDAAGSPGVGRGGQPSAVDNSAALGLGATALPTACSSSQNSHASSTAGVMDPHEPSCEVDAISTDLPTPTDSSRASTDGAIADGYNSNLEALAAACGHAREEATPLLLEGASNPLYGHDRTHHSLTWPALDGGVHRYPANPVFGSSISSSVAVLRLQPFNDYGMERSSSGSVADAAELQSCDALPPALCTTPPIKEEDMETMQCDAHTVSGRPADCLRSTFSVPSRQLAIPYLPRYHSSDAVHGQHVLQAFGGGAQAPFKVNVLQQRLHTSTAAIDVTKDSAAACCDEQPACMPAVALNTSECRSPASEGSSVDFTHEDFVLVEVELALNRQRVNAALRALQQLPITVRTPWELLPVSAF